MPVGHDLLKEIQPYVFIKNLPNDRITLHDEMRRLVNTYAWPEVDPDDDNIQRVQFHWAILRNRIIPA